MLKWAETQTAWVCLRNAVPEEYELFVAHSSAPRKRVHVDLRMSRFNLPPVRSALVVGRRSGIGPKALEKALQEMMPGAFRRFDVEHDVVEAILLNEAHLRRLSKDQIIALILRHAEGMLDASETLHVDLDIEVEVHEEFEL